MPGRIRRRQEACGHADAAYGHRGTVPQAEDYLAPSEPSCLSVSASWCDGGAPQPGLGDGHHLFADGRGFVYLVAVLDWYSRRVLAWRVSITMDTAFCLEALEEAIQRFGPPELVNTDQGSQFTSLAFIELLKSHDIEISMDGKGAWRDNVFIERLWKTVKYEEGYLKAYDRVSDVKQGLATYFHFYNGRRPHSMLEKQTPDQVYLNNLSIPRAA